jgi:histidinol dehydrogenase
MRVVSWSGLDKAARVALLARPAARTRPEIVATVARILTEIEAEGFEAVRRWARTLDRVEPFRLDISPRLVDKARADLEDEDIAAIELAVETVHAFHERTRPVNQRVETRTGVICEKIWRPLAAAGLYVPGGAAPLVSTLIMLAEPARAAGVREIVVATPPRDGAIAPAMIVAAGICGIEALWAMGGAQAIGAMAFGAGVPAVQKICGPGNAYVAEAKRQIAARGNLAAIDLPAGPSELMAIADDAADEALVAADLLSQAEHDADAQVIAVVRSDAFAAKLARAVERQLDALPRANIARASLAHGCIIAIDDVADAITIANAYAPEHLALHIEDAAQTAPRFENAGAVFVGAASAEVFGDYIAGPSHVLPTDGAARIFGGVTVESFMRLQSVQTLSALAAASISDPAARLARLEGLEAHARAAELRR